MEESEDKRETWSVVEIGGRFVEAVIYGCPKCVPTKKDRADIAGKINRGFESGSLCSDQPGKQTSIYGRWRLIPWKINPGMRVRFSTSGKYNPGFYTGNVYEGTVIRQAGHKWVVYVEGIGQAIIPSKHVEEILSNTNIQKS